MALLAAATACRNIKYIPIAHASCGLSQSVKQFGLTVISQQCSMPYLNRESGGSGYPDCRRVRGFGASGAEADHAETTSGALSLQRDPCIKQTADCAPLLASAHIREPYITYCILNHGTPEGAELRARRHAQPVRGGSANGVRASPARDRRDGGLGGCVYSSLMHAVTMGSCAMELN